MIVHFPMNLWTTIISHVHLQCQKVDTKGNYVYVIVKLLEKSTFLISLKNLK